MILPTNNEDLLQQLLWIFDRTKEMTDDWRTEARSFVKLYNSFVDKDTYPMAFKLFMPIAFTVIESALPDFYHSLLYRSPMVQVFRTHPMTPMESVHNADRILNKKWMPDHRTISDFTMGVKEARIIGTACFEVYHSLKTQVVPMHYPVLGSDGVRIAGSTIEESVNIENRSRLRHWDMFDTYPDIEHVHEDEMQFCAREFFEDYDNLVHSDVPYKGLSEFEEDDASLDEYSLESRLQNSMVNPRQHLPQYETQTLPKKPRHIIEFIIRHQTRQGEKIRIVTIINRKKIIRKQTMAFWPLVFLRNNPDPHVFLGRSELQPIKSLNLTYNDVTNLSLENMLMALNKMLLVGDGAGLDLDSFDLVPNGVMHVDDISQIKEMAWNDLNPSYSFIQKSLLDHIDRAVGQSDYSRGSTPPRKEFATTVAFIQQAGSKRNDQQIKWYEKSGVSRIGKKFLECGQAYLYEPDYVQNDADPNIFDEIDMYSLQGLMEVDVVSSAIGISEMRRSQLHDFTQDVVQLLGPSAPGLLRLKILKEVANTYTGLDGFVEDVDQFITQMEAQGAGGMTPEMLQQMQMQMQQQLPEGQPTAA